MKPAEHFKVAAGDPRFREWVEKERQQAIKYLANAGDLHQVYRAQGKVQLLDDMLACIEVARNLR